MTIDEMIAVLEAAKAGKRIQAKLRFPRPGDRQEWGAPIEPSMSSWDFNRYDYRVAPEPREWWLPVDLKGKPMARLCETLEYATECSYNGTTFRPTHVREVME